MYPSSHGPTIALIRHNHFAFAEAFTVMYRSPSIGKRREHPGIGCAFTLGLFFLFWLVGSTAFGETPAPSVHWGSLAFPDQYSTLTTGLTLNRFTPIDGTGGKYDSTVPNTMGFNMVTFSWTQHGHEHFEGWSFNLTGGIGPHLMSRVSSFKTRSFTNYATCRRLEAYSRVRIRTP